MLVNKFIQKYGQKQKGNINKEVDNYVKNNKISEGGLKELEQKIMKEGDNTKLPQIQQDDQKSIRSNKSMKSNRSQQQMQQSQQDYDQMSYQSSNCRRSVYELGDEDDEWATIIKFDQELFKKEKELQMIREQEQKKKMKRELDRQVNEKQMMVQAEREELG